MINTATRPIWEERPHPLAVLAKGAALVAIVVVIAFPFLLVVSTSLAPQDELTANGGYVLWTNNPTLDAYRQILSGGAVSKAVMVSLLVTLVGTAISLGATVLAAYALSQRRLPWHRTFLGMVLLTFLFTPGMIPLYLMVKQLGLLDTYAALILPTAISAFNIVIMRGFFMTIPGELLDSAKIDGAGHWLSLTRIVLPLSRAVIAVIGLFYAVGYWNSFFNALLYLNDSSMWPLQLVLRTYVLQGSPVAQDAGAVADVLPPTQALQMAVVVIAIIPILCIYPFLQRHFKTGVLTGAVKG
ncbi:carbohydrate ABC transporter permease [Arthrobacter tecti]